MSKQNYVFVLDTNRKPLSPCRPITARKLLQAKKAAVFRLFPFTIILKKAVDETPEPISVKLDPGSKNFGKKVGRYLGRVAVRWTGSFNISVKSAIIQGISHKCCLVIHRKDGYGYSF